MTDVSDEELRELIIYFVKNTYRAKDAPNRVNFIVIMVIIIVIALL